MFASLVVTVLSMASTMTLIVGMNPDYKHRSNTAFLCFGNVVHKLLLEICSPFQKLELKSTNEGRSGFSFSSYELQ